MNHFPVPISEEQRQKVANMPAIQRAFEFLALGEEYSARREWHHAIDNMTSYQMQMAASLAAEKNWHDRAILALGKAKAYDDLETRFPLIHQGMLENYAGKRGLHLAWMYGVIRTESAFWEDARSPAGALGLMQVMPRTGQETARRLGLKNFNTNQLLQAEAQHAPSAAST
ncbi:MAG: transglycosylase SLT domain-containing protein [Gammaproteobacteria bacterium]|nr:transglycosylase SLT domain-containing protein [Gammaproteobacteria bacterium]